MTKAANVVLYTLVGLLGVCVLIVSGAILLFDYMAQGELHSYPSAERITIAFSSSEDVYRVMRDICRSETSNEQPPSIRNDLYAKLLAIGTLAQASDGTRVKVHENGSYRSWFPGGDFTHFEFSNGPWKNREAWTCPSSVVLLHALP
jgi:hypothetical protein